MSLLVVVGILVLLLSVLSVMAAACRNARNREERLKALLVTDPPSLPRREPIEVPQDRRAGFYLRELLTGRGLVGLFCVLLSAVLIPVNSRILAAAWSLMLDSAGTAVFLISVAGYQITVYDLDLFGFGLSLALLLLSAAFAAKSGAKSARFFIGFFGILPILSLEILVSGFRGWMVAQDAGTSPVVMAIANGLLAQAAAVAEIIAAYLIHGAVVPLIQAAGWAVVAPFRVAARALKWWAEKRYWRKAHDPPIGVLTRLGARLDEAFFEPLRRVVK